MKSKIAHIKYGIYRHRGKICFAAGFGTASFIAYKSRGDLNAFLEEHGLLEEYYLPEKV
jgi:hypothetical protein